MTGPTRAAAALVAAAATLAAGCGGTAGDLLSIETSGGPAGAHTVVVSGDGRGSCDRGPLTELPSERVLDARELEGDVADLARRAADYPPRDGAVRYELGTGEGVVRWSSGTPGLPAALPRAELLALELRRDLCPGG